MSFNVRLFGYSGIIQVGQSHAQQYSGDAVFLNEEPCLWSQLLVCNGSAIATSTRITTGPDGTQMVCVEVPDGHEIRYEVVQPGVAARTVNSNSRRGSGSFNLAWSPGYTLSLIEAVPPPSAQAAAFLARAPGLDALHIAAYTALIDGLVSDGVWAKLDVLRLYRTQDSTTALLNLIQDRYNGTAYGSPLFTVDRGFTGVEGSSTVYIDSNFNPTTAVSPKFTRNSASLGVWLDSTARASPAFGAQNGTVDTLVYGQYSGDMRFYFRLNCGHTLGIISSIQLPNIANGLVVANRSGVNDMQGYRSGSLLTFGNASGSVAPPNLNLYELGTNTSGTPNGSGYQQSMAFIGSEMNVADEGNLATRALAYMTMIGGVP